MSSFTDDSNSVSLTPRPQSVAQRILRERQERNITDKVPVTPSATKTKASKKGKEKSRSQPLYLALKSTAKKKNLASKSELAEKIKQEALLAASDAYKVPPLPEEFYESMKKLQNNSFLKDKKEDGGMGSKPGDPEGK